MDEKKLRSQLEAVQENAKAFKAVGEALGRSLNDFEAMDGLRHCVNDDDGSHYSDMRDFIARELKLNPLLWED